MLPIYYYTKRLKDLCKGKSATIKEQQALN